MVFVITPFLRQRIPLEINLLRVLFEHEVFQPGRPTDAILEAVKFNPSFHRYLSGSEVARIRHRYAVTRSVEAEALANHTRRETRAAKKRRVIPKRSRILTVPLSARPT